jgi:hypothetical protein
MILALPLSLLGAVVIVLSLILTHRRAVAR